MLPLSLEIVAIITVLIGIIVNGYILLIVTFTKQIAYVNKLLLLHLGVVNTLICFTYLTFYVMSLLNLLVLVDIACIIFGLSFNIMHSVALWNLCALNFDRYFAIASPLHYGALINTKKVLIGLGCGWIVSIFFALPQLLQVSPYYYDTFYEFCLPNYKTAGSLVYNTSLTAFTIFLPIILIFGCNMKVLMIARYQRHRIASAILEVTLSAQLTITHQRNPFFIPSFTSAVQNPTALKIHTHHSPVSSIFQLVGSIIFIYCPYYFCNLWNNVIEAVRTEEKNNVETDLLIPKIVLQISATLLLLSPFVNALLYGIKNKIIRKSFHNFWRKQKSKIEIHYEIQARTPSTCGSRRPSINGTNSAQPLLHRQLSETFLEISKADINNIQSDIKLRSESLWSSNSKLSSYSVLNSPIGNQTTSNLTPGPTFSTNEPKFVYLNPSSSPPPPPLRHMLLNIRQYLAQVVLRRFHAISGVP
ncbi:alpha-1A adrenergic receptor isoform X1 [Culex quinquefasciatus]|uniref:alpha-1A adrenergic receptor isoform X1 n=1 Tax=Culex quinquefasciatus TaxID=7176 RepID=UPI0018E2C3F1|nr:alpha-1A adrenergic receptor isoform X1 [Culex quinquefasciatus]XP_038122970.1 alpha-1A adrenergic receptor isoform X1 [Culex quinquefasciatus]